LASVKAAFASVVLPNASRATPLLYQAATSFGSSLIA
jgi:hypothetical protein